MKTLSNNGGRRRGAAREMLGLIMLALLLGGLGYMARPALSRIVVPSIAGASLGGEGVGGFFTRLGERLRTTESLIAENRDLSEKLKSSQILVLDRNVLYEENAALKAQFGRDVSPNVVLAAVLIRPGETPYDTLVIDVGEDKSVRKGDRVTAGGTLLIGKVDEVYAHTARVLLYSSPGSTYEGFLRGTIPVEVVGQGGGSLKAEVPYDSKPVEGDTVSLPSLEANVAFVIEYVEAGRGDSASTAYLRLPISPFELKYVEVWRADGSGT